MKKTLTATLALLISAGLLSGCAAAQTAPTPTATETPEEVPTELTLRVPPTATGTNVSLEVSGGPLPKGTEATIYRFDGGWDGGEPTCDNPKAETRSVVLNGDGKYQPLGFNVVPGVTQWVIVAGGFATECGELSTVVKVETKANIFTGGADATTKANEPKKIEVEITSAPTPVPVSGNVLIFGPWKTIPEAQSASCEGSTPAFTLPLEIDYSGVSPRGAVEVTPTEPGIYRVVVQTGETEQSTELDTCATGDPVTFAATAP